MKKTFSKIDKPLFFITILLCSIGLLMVFSSSSVSAILRYNKPSTYFFIRQLIFLIAAFIGGFIILKIPTKWYKSISWLLIVGITAVLILLLLYGGITNHVQSWFYIPGTGIALQPSEFAKSFLIIFMAVFYNRLIQKKTDNVILYLIPLSVAGILGLLILMQPDFGSAAILLAIGFCIFISIPMVKNNLPKIMMILGVGAVLLVIVLLYSGAEILNSDQMKRLQFQNPCQRYKEDTGYQVCNGYIAINNGGLTGVGLGNSTQKYLYLPESHTDFIFAVLVEELGLLAGVGVLILYGIMLYRILKIAKEAYTLRNSILAYGTFWMLSFHIIINLCGMLSILPLTGVPLPLMSYGGSSTLNFIAMLFITQRVAIENKTTKYKLELKYLSN
ncbi:MAG: FtsW/RodA/SpoVE family cell cycle protein [Firmicutes bacterium]|nr:FtsW/RodA/SpoVE family cell cycle protein [Bacillota bacterium]